MLKSEIEKLKEAFANYVFTEGCSCCEREGHSEYYDIICDILDYDPYEQDEHGNYIHETKK